jgi:CBS domain-containing protein
LTSVIFALELTHDLNVLPALLIASTVAHGFTVLVMKRSILTEKVARRGYHISREYAVDPLERLSVGEVMATDVVTVAASISIRDLMTRYFFGSGGRGHTGYPVVDKAGRLLGVITRSNFLDHWTDTLLSGGDEIGSGPIIAYDLIDLPIVTAHPGESCRVAAERMARAGVKRLPVVAPDDPARLLGIVSLGDLLRARQRQLDEESRRERFYGPRRAAPGPPTDRA